MSLGHGAKITTDGLVLCLDAANPKSYPGSGTTWFDLSGNNNHGTLINGVGYSTDNKGSMLFDGTNDYVTLTSNYTLLDGWTLSFWGATRIPTQVTTIFYSASNPRTFTYRRPIGESSVSGLYIDNSNNLYVSTTYMDENRNLSILKFNSSYELDTSFNCGDIGFYSTFMGISKLSTYLQDKMYTIYIGETLTSKYNQRGLRRLNTTDGSLDTSFNADGVGFLSPSQNQGVSAFFEDSNGKLLVWGVFTSYNGTTANRIIRLNTDGTIDTSFNYGTGFNNNVSGITIDSNGKLLVYGNFTSYNGTTANRIIRLNTDGSIDTSFNTGTGFNNFVRDVIIDSNGKLLVYGNFTSYNGTTANKIIRLNTDGTIDTSFNYGTGFNNNVSGIIIDSNGKLLVWGVFTSYNGTTANRIIRLNTDGTIDTSFNYGTGFNGFVSGITIDSNGKLLVWGGFRGFTSYNGTTANKIIRLNTDGSIDTSFNYGTGFNGFVSGIIIDSNGKLLVYGNFTSYNGTTVSPFILLNSDGTLNTDIMSGLPVARRIQSHSSSFFDTMLDLKEVGLANNKIMTDEEFDSIFDGNNVINVVETMSPTGTHRYYMNGILLFEAENIPDPRVNVQGIARGIASAWYHNGKLCNIGIYDKELTNQEVRQNFNALRGRYGI